MTLAGKKVAVSFPDTVLEEKDSPRDKTWKLGLIARACAIYGVDVVEVFPGGARGEWEVVRKVLEYLETPQYLRKRLFPLDETLRYAGMLPPLRIPSHKPKVDVGALSVGEFREGVMEQDGTVYAGLDENVAVRGGAKAGGRVTVRLTGIRPLRGEVVRPESVGEYWGYRVQRKALAEVFTDSSFGLKIATSKFGDGLSQKLPELRDRLGVTSAVKLVFGSPSKGLFDLVGKDLRQRADLVLNLFPGQKVETVRSEEAIFAGLNLLSVLSA